MNLAKSFDAQNRYSFCYNTRVVLLGVLKTDRDIIVFLGHSVIYYRISRWKISVAILPQRFIKAERIIRECVTCVCSKIQKSIF